MFELSDLVVCCSSRRMIVTDCHFFFVSNFCVILHSFVLVDVGVLLGFLLCCFRCGGLVGFCVFDLLRITFA